MKPETSTYLPGRQVWERYGVTAMSLHRWVRDPDMRFPEPIYIGRHRFWLLADLEGWERTRPRGRTLAAAEADA